MMAESGCRDRSHLTLDLKGLKPTPNNDSGLSPIFTAMPLSPEKIQFGTQQQQQIQAQQPQQHHQILETPTPSNFFTKNPTSAQESFAEGFIEVFKKVQGSHATPINNSPSALKFLHTLFGHLSPNGTTKTFLGQEQQQPGIVSRLSPGTVAKDFLTHQQPQPIQQLPSPSGTANQQFLPGTDSSCALRLNVPQIVLSNTNSSNNNCGVNSDLISAAVAAAAAAATTAQQQSQQSPQQQLNSPLSVGSTTAVVTGSAAGEDSSSPYSTAASSVNSVGDIGATTANTYMDYHLANLGQLSPAVTSAVGNNIAAGGVDFFQPQLAQFNSSAAIGLMAQQHPPKDIKREQQQPNNNAAVGIDHVILKQHAAAAAAATQLNGMPFVGMRGKLSSAARTNVLQSFQTHISAHHHHNHHHHNAKSESYGGGRQNLKGADTGDQDMKKLERKRARNRLAASKCRQRKLQRITDLEQQVNEERERGSELQMQINQLQNVIRELEGRLKANEHQQQHMSIITHRQNS